MNLFLIIFIIAMGLLCAFVFMTYLNTVYSHDAIITPLHTHNNITVDFLNKKSVIEGLLK